jgi:anti-anti-sigma regulatory factor
MTTPTLVLPEELTIYTVGDLRAQWLGWLADLRDDAVIDGAAVGQVDAAGVQLLTSLARSLESRELGWRMQGVGGALREACRTLGLGGRLGTEPSEAVSA